MIQSREVLESATSYGIAIISSITAVLSPVASIAQYLTVILALVVVIIRLKHDLLLLNREKNHDKKHKGHKK
jgi:hypothetical protein